MKRKSSKVTFFQRGIGGGNIPKILYERRLGVGILNAYLLIEIPVLLALSVNEGTFIVFYKGELRWYRENFSSLGFILRTFIVNKGVKEMKLTDLSTKYDFKKVEQNKYQEWVKNGYFTAGDVSKKPYAMVIPPPNITGKLHLGHTLNKTIQDIIIRRKRMQGYDTLWLPGMDHASIATQAKVEEKLRKEGISRYDLGREEFLKVCWQWKEDHEDMIHNQWARLGLSLDYTRERFTLDEGLNEAVNEVFVRMYEDGLIYRGERIINWDVQSQTALSNIEVEYKEIEGAFYYIKYQFTDSSMV